MRKSLAIEGIITPVPRGAWVRLAAFRCIETDRLARELGFPVAVVAAVRDPAAHARWLSDRWHGALRPRGADWSLPFDTHEAHPWTVEYEQIVMDPRWMGGRALPRPMAFAGGCVDITLPPRVGSTAFASALRAVMADRRFDVVAGRPAQVERRVFTRRPLAVEPRYSALPADMRRPRRVDDLYAFRPRDLPVIVAKAAMALEGLKILSGFVAEAGGSEVSRA